MFNLFNLIDEENNKKQEEVKEVQATTTQHGQTTEEPTVGVSETATSTVGNKTAEVCTNNVEDVGETNPTAETTSIDPAAQIREKMNNANSNEMVTDFSDSDVSEQEKKLEEEENKNSIANKVAASKTAKTEEKDKFAPNEFTIIRYYGQDIPVTQYLTPEELAEGLPVKKNGSEERKPVTAEDLRKRMEKEHPELVSSHTELLFIEKKGASYIVPTIKAKKKGAEPVSNDADSAFPLIPYSILGQFIELAKLFAEQHYEVHADIYFNLETRTYTLDVPGQLVHQYWCEVTEDTRDVIQRIGLSSVKVAEIHSHHYMRPIPSSQDNASETVPKIKYIIVGNIGDFYPSITARTYNGQNWDKLNIANVFERPSYALPNFDGNKIAFKKGAIA
ncbi:hypothetical protein D7X33_20210 [Butyricicoccus sp. 1XD8-22]|nr:hypothetical protein D7X33_20210 [Butyricicoccus sp. 1XD8-22]